MDLLQLIFIAPFILLIGWLIAEFRFGRFGRITLGFLTMLAIFVLVGLRIPSLAQSTYPDLVSKLAQFAAKGYFQDIQEVLSAYNQTEKASGSSDVAVKKAWETASKIEKADHK
jgi:hypothetical protein